MEKDKDFMKRAISLAQKGKGRTSPNPLNGCVIVNQEEIVGEGFYQGVGTPHAEIYAIDAAGSKTNLSTLYTTIEPCVDRIDSCTDRIISSGIKRVVIGLKNPNPSISGKGIQKLKESGIDVELGIEENLIRRINEIYIKYIQTKRPFVTIVNRMSLDGKTATSIGDITGICSEETENYIYELRAEYDAVIVSINTILHNNPQINCKYQGGKNPWKIIIDSEAQTPLNSRIFLRQNPDNLRTNTIIVVSKQAPEDRIKNLKIAGAEVIRCPEDFSDPLNLQIDLEKLMIILGKRGITSILVEGGGTLNSSFIFSRIADKIIIFISPKIIGGKTHFTPVGGNGISLIEEAIPIFNWEYSKIGSDLMIQGYFYS